MKSEFVLKDLGDGLKAIDYSAFGGMSGYLQDTSTGAGGSVMAQLLRRVNAWAAKAQDMTAIALSELPFDIMRGGKIIDDSHDWRNVLGGMPSPQRVIYKIASSLCLGRAYIIPQYTDRMITDLHFCAPHTVFPMITTEGLIQFNRTSDYGQTGTYYPLGKSEIMPPGFTGEMMYFWLADSDVEIGPARSYPAGAALQSAELITAMDATLHVISERGFVPPTMLAAKGMISKDERDKAEAFWNKFLRRWSEGVAKIVNAETMNVIKVGAGMEDLKSVYTEIKKQAIEDLGAAYGIPSAIFQSDRAFATEVNPLIKVWYSTSIFMRLYQTIEDTFNEQLLNKFDCRIEFHPDELDAFQEDEGKRAIAFRDYVSTNAGRPSIWAEALGLDLPEGIEYSALDEFYDKNLASQNAEKPVNPLNNPSEVIAQITPPGIVQAPASKSMILSPNEAKDYSDWYDTAKRNMKNNKALPVDWQCKFLPEAIAVTIREKLAVAQNQLDVVKAFEIGEVSEILILAEAINNAVKK